MKRIYFLSKLFFISVFLSGCSASDVLNFTIPDAGYIVYKDLAYGENPRQVFDVYVPQNIKAPKKVIVFFYGGRWQSGEKKTYKFVGQAFASKGYITVIADYRLYPEIKYPEFMKDAAKVMAWVNNDIKIYGGDKDNVYVAGHSAGAYIAAMLAVKDDYLKEVGGDSSWIKGVIGLAGPYDFLPFTDGDIKEIFSNEQDIKTQPVSFARAGLPPMLLLTGDEDKDVLPKNTKNFAAKLRSFNNSVTEKIYPDVAHIGIVIALANGFRSKAPVLDDITAFIDSASGQ